MRRLTRALSASLLMAFAMWGASRIHAQDDGRQELAADGAFDLRLVSNGDVLLLVAQNGRGSLEVFRSAGGGPFLATPFISTTPFDRQVFGAWAPTHGFYVLRYSRTHAPLLSRSVDGLQWDAVESPVFDAPADIHDIVQLANGDLLAIGALRLGTAPNPSPRVRGAMWRSRDGATWESVTIPAVLADATFSSIAVLGSNVVLLGEQSNAPASWRSDDGGASWVALDGGRDRPERVVGAGGRFIRISTPWPWEVPEIRFSTSIDGRDWRDGVARSLIRLTSPDTIEYSVEGRGAIAIYGPTDEPLPICI